jgi:EAL domain-containing protein (putative c-di-GMP-specific phosphodiesterase class I)/GGDEF domain-containing protein
MDHPRTGGWRLQYRSDGVFSLSTTIGKCAIVLVDIGHFDELQTRLGLEAGRNLMQLLSTQFKDVLGPRGSLERIRDAGFSIQIETVHNAGHARLAAQRFWQITEQCLRNVGIANPDIRIGIALNEETAVDSGRLLQQAHVASLAAKARQQRIVQYDASCDVQVLHNWQLSDAFTQALQTGEVSLYYQPKIRVRDRQVIGAEALIRWIKDDQAVANPETLVALAEAAGLAHETAWYALSSALRAIPQLGNINIAVNVTPAMLHLKDFLDMVQAAIRNWRISPAQLTLEVTESALIADFERDIAQLAALRELGVRISIDDFGTGYSSLSYFKKIPADELKIDKSFVTSMLQNTEDARLVSAIITLAHQFGLQVVAEGVEDLATLEALAKLQCDGAQGYYFAPAMPATDFLKWWQSYK